MTILACTEACVHGRILDCAPGRTRTCDSKLRKLELYPLSYRGVDTECAHGTSPGTRQDRVGAYGAASVPGGTGPAVVNTRIGRFICAELREHRWFGAKWPPHRLRAL